MLLDLAHTSLVALPLAWRARTGLWVAVGISLCRPLFIYFGVLRSVRVRERGAWVLGAVMVSSMDALRVAR